MEARGQGSKECQGMLVDKFYCSVHVVAFASNVVEVGCILLCNVNSCWNRCRFTPNLDLGLISPPRPRSAVLRGRLAACRESDSRPEWEREDRRKGAKPPLSNTVRRLCLISGQRIFYRYFPVISEHVEQRRSHDSAVQCFKHNYLKYVF